MPDQEPQNAAQDPTIGPMGGIALGALSGAAQSIKLDQPVAPPIKLDTPVTPPDLKDPITGLNAQEYSQKYNTPLDVAARHIRANQHPADNASIPVSAAPQGDDFDQMGANIRGNIENLGAGLLKTAEQDVSGLSGLAEKYIPGAASIQAVRENAAAGRSGEQAPEGGMQEAGNVLGNIVEFVTGDAALKGLSLADKLGIAQKMAKFAEESPKIAAALHIGMAALRQGTVSGVQTAVKGGTGTQVATNAAATGVASAVFGGASAGMGTLYRNIADHSPEAIQAATQAAKDSGEELANKIAQGPIHGPTAPLGSAQENVEAIRDKINSVRLQMQADYSHGLALVTEQGKDIPVPVAGSSVEKLAGDILKDTTLPEKLQQAAKALGAEESQIQPMLQDFATGKDTYGWTDMENFRRILGDRIRTLNGIPGGSTLEAPLTALRDSIDDTMQKAAEASGNNKIASEMEEVRTRYAIQKKAFNATAVQTLLTAHPDAVADLLLDKGETIYNVNALRDILTEQGTHPEAMKSVEAHILKRLIYTSSTSIDGFSPSVFVKQFNNLGPDVQQAIWGDVLPQVKDVVQAAQNIPRDSVVWGGLARYMEHRALFDVVLGAGALGAVTGAEQTKGTGRKIFGSAAILGGVLLLHDAALLKFATQTLQGAAKAATPVVAGTLSQTNSTPPPDQNKEHSENMPEVPAGHTHVKTSDGSEFFVPNEHVENAKALDPGLQLLQQAGNPNNG